MVHDQSHGIGFRFTFRHLIILIVYFAILFRVIIPISQLGGSTSIGRAVLVALLFSPPLLTVLVTFIERPGPLRNWAVSLLLCLFFPALLLNHDVTVLIAYLESGQRPTLWATLLVNAVILPISLPYVARMIPRACPSCGWRTLVPLLRVFKKDKRTAKTCWCASCGAKYWKDQEGNWRLERRTTWLDHTTDPLRTSETQTSPGGRPEVPGTPHRPLGGRAPNEIHSS